VSRRGELDVGRVSRARAALVAGVPGTAVRARPRPCPLSLERSTFAVAQQQVADGRPTGRPGEVTPAVQARVAGAVQGQAPEGLAAVVGAADRAATGDGPRESGEIMRTRSRSSFEGRSRTPAHVAPPSSVAQHGPELAHGIAAPGPWKATLERFVAPAAAGCPTSIRLCATETRRGVPLRPGREQDGETGEKCLSTLCASGYPNQVRERLANGDGRAAPRRPPAGAFGQHDDRLAAHPPRRSVHPLRRRRGAACHRAPARRRRATKLAGPDRPGVITRWRVSRGPRWAGGRLRRAPSRRRRGRSSVLATDRLGGPLNRRHRAGADVLYEFPRAHPVAPNDVIALDRNAQRRPACVSTATGRDASWRAGAVRPAGAARRHGAPRAGRPRRSAASYCSTPTSRPTRTATASATRRRTTARPSPTTRPRTPARGRRPTARQGRRPARAPTTATSTVIEAPPAEVSSATGRPAPQATAALAGAPRARPFG